MAVPDFQSLMLPVLRALSGGEEMSLAAIRARVSHSEGLTPENLQELLPSLRQPVFTNRVSWVILDLRQAKLLVRVRRGVYRITEEGKKLATRGERIDRRTLRQYPDYAQWIDKITQNREKPGPVEVRDQVDTPEEVLQKTVDEIRKSLETDLLEQVRNASPEFLERLIVDILIAMGYGAGDKAMGSVTGRSGDHGIDGTIKEDILGLDEVYIQAKKYADGNTVGERALRDFAGAIDLAGTTKGVFVTTSTFTSQARKYVERSPKRIILIDGEKLASFMVDYDVGVRSKVTFEIKRMDEDYFELESD